MGPWVQIRSASLEDVDLLAELVILYRTDMGFPPADSNAVSTFLREEMCNQRLLVSIALVDGEAQGFLLAAHTFSLYSLSPAIYFADLWIGAGYRRQGLGKALIEHELSRHSRDTYSFCLVAEGNLAAKTLVNSLGFLGTHIAFYRRPARPEEAL